MDFPDKFDRKAYVEWHEMLFSEDKNFEHKLESLVENLKLEARNDLIVLNEFLSYISQGCNSEFAEKNWPTPDYFLPLNELLETKKETEYGQQLFKQPISIINKLWRKKKFENKKIPLAKLKEEIKDLVRTELIANSIDACKYIVERINLDEIKDKELKVKCDNLINEINFEPKIKVESGYFAHHGLISFNSGLIVEIQIYSRLMQQWRKISHLVYDKGRINPPENYDFEMSETKLISLGHLLYIAENQFDQIQKDISSEYSQKKLRIDQIQY